MNSETIRDRVPAEWEPHEAVWAGWPSAADLWLDNLGPAQAEVAAFVRAVARPDTDDPTLVGEIVRLLVRGPDARAAATDMLGDLITAGAVELIEAPIGDVWLRDTAPVFVQSGASQLAACFRFNGWGGKYLLPSDDEIAGIVASRAGRTVRASSIVLEGGAVDFDGEGTILTTRQCLLNRNRNPGFDEADAEAELKRMFGAERVIWLNDGLLNDHTDGHVDNLARFVAPGRVVVMRPTGNDDPNADVYADTLRALSHARDAAGRQIDIVEIPSPGRVLDEDGKVVPASHVNFYIANASLIVPIYAETDAQEAAAERAVETLADEIDRAHVYAIGARSLLTGGGSFHCITQQQPRSNR